MAITQEQTTGAAETLTTTADDELTDDGVKSSPESKDAVSKRETSKRAESKEPRTYTDDEFDLEVEKRTNTRAQSLKDKELTPVYEERNKLRKENADLKKVVDRKQVDTLVNVLERDTEDGTAEEDAPKVKDFGRLRTLITRLRTLEDGEAGLEDTAKRQSEIERTQSAQLMALQHLLPDGDEFKSSYESLVKSLMECKTEREMELTLKVLGKKTAGDTENNNPPRRTDSGRSTGHGGSDQSRMTPEEKIEAGLKQLKKK
jgi:hypothetical protein